MYNVNGDTKQSLVEAALSLGVFEKDENVNERIGLLEHFATYIPKKAFRTNFSAFSEEEIKIINENFNVIPEYEYKINIERLLQDPNFINLFNSKEEAKEQLENVLKSGRELNYSYTEDEIENIMRNYDDAPDSDRSKIIQYILKTGYDKEKSKNEFSIQLKTDLQKEKEKNLKEGKELERKIRQILYKNPYNIDGLMTPDKLHKIFDGMDMEYKPGFYEFLKNNLNEILESEDKQSEISRIQKSWKQISQEYLGQKITFEKCERYLSSIIYDNVENIEIAKLSSNCGYTQEDFEKAQNIYKRQLQRKKSSIPQVEGKNENAHYTYKVLRLDDPITIFVGELTDCCQAVGNAGESCMIHSATSQNGRVLVVQDENGKVLSQSWIWRNGNVLCFDNIEAVQKDSNNKKIVSNEILETIIQAAKDFVEKDKEGIKKYEEEKTKEAQSLLEQGKISRQEYKDMIEKIKKIVRGQQLTKVTVGIGYTDVDLRGLKRDNENRFPEENVEYISDSRTQLVLYEDTSIEHEASSENTVAMYEDDEGSKDIVGVDTSEVDRKDDDWNDEDGDWHNDEDDEQFEFSALEEDNNGTINTEDIKETVAHPKDRGKARQALENIKKYLKENSIDDKGEN